MQKNILIIRSVDDRMQLKTWFSGSKNDAQRKAEDFCRAHNFDSNNFFYEIYDYKKHNKGN